MRQSGPQECNAAIDAFYAEEAGVYDSHGVFWQYHHRRTPVFPGLMLHTPKRSGFVLHSYRSGELTGASFHTGYDGCFPPSRSGRLVTGCLTPLAKKLIRRSIQNAEMDFHCFMTVTFDPKCSEMERIEGAHIQSGAMGVISPLLTGKYVVDQIWAKEKFKRFINSIKVSCDRRATLTSWHNEEKRLAYVWVAEIQKSGNIHFHVLVNQRLPIKWLSKLWGQAANSIDVRSIQNKNHASCYLRKYISKSFAPITGNRYGISQNLRETMKPIKRMTDDKDQVKAVNELIDSLKADIEQNGGRIIDFGFHIPAPSRSVVYCKKGKMKKTKAISSQIAPFIINKFLDVVDPLPF